MFPVVFAYQLVILSASVHIYLHAGGWPSTARPSCEVSSFNAVYYLVVRRNFLMFQ